MRSAGTAASNSSCALNAPIRPWRSAACLSPRPPSFQYSTVMGRYIYRSIDRRATLIA
jgi:hypothetical protein